MKNKMELTDKIYIENSRFMEFIDEMATQMTEMTYGEATWSCYRKYGGDFKMKDEPQDFYNLRYDEIEDMVNKIMGIYSDNDKNN